MRWWGGRGRIKMQGAHYAHPIHVWIFIMTNLIDELENYINEKEPQSQYYTLHKGYIEDESISFYKLKAFLSARMDEVRIRYATDYAKKILEVTDIDDFNFFSIGVLKREISGDISFYKQRDHSAHALYNYILGWYIFENIACINESFKTHCKLREIDKEGWTTDYFHYQTFFELWPFVSLLHDIGYLFEGSISTVDIATQSNQILRGAEFVNQYFKHNFWVENDFYAIDDRKKIMSMLTIKEPELNSRSLGELADSLRFLDNLEALTREINYKI
jgi:hypothetical protein